MAGGHKPQRRDKPSIKYQCGSLRGASLELVGFGHQDNVSSATDNKKKSRTSESRDVQIFSTRELISALGSIWDHVTGPLSILVPKSTCRNEDGCPQKCNIIWYFSDDMTRNMHIAAVNQNKPVNLMTVGDSLPMVSVYLGYLKVRNKISFIQPCSGTYSLLRRLLMGNHQMIQETLKEKHSSIIGLQCDLLKIYGWMGEIALPNRERLVNFSGMEKHDGGDCHSGPNMSDPVSSISVDKTSSANKFSIENGKFHSNEIKFAGVLSGQNNDPTSSMKASAATLSTEHGPVQDTEACRSKIPSSSFYEDSLGSPVPSISCDFDESKISIKPDLHESKITHQKDFAVEENSEVDICLPMKEKPHSKVAKQEHAFAGAMAGICVSLSLHPVDTIKTVVQSCRADQKTLHDTFRSIISQRGVPGLYRGISTNIACSAPISAVYTFTYESIKGNLLPFLPKEYQSVAHCMAGGSASIATSFIFTPSERIKQQMQVGSRYQNCWSAIVGIIGKGGLSSLYAGWVAVLCRNVPHSIIKFYTYESLKQLLSSVRFDGQTNIFLTLVSGGLAGSTAALFTTPFDVVKTRLQTQVPGSVNQYPGVFDTLKEIAKKEGLKGLYRGLTPRLFMYMTQGGLFFASYESFKRLFSLDSSQVNVQAVTHKKIEEDDPSSCLHKDAGSTI